LAAIKEAIEEYLTASQLLFLLFLISKNIKVRFWVILDDFYILI
jgi:hypothetical protein